MIRSAAHSPNLLPGACDAVRRARQWSSVVAQVRQARSATTTPARAACGRGPGRVGQGVSAPPMDVLPRCPVTTTRPSAACTEGGGRSPSSLPVGEVPAFPHHQPAVPQVPSAPRRAPISPGRLITGAPKPPRELREPCSVVPASNYHRLLAVRGVLGLQTVLLGRVDAHHPHPSRWLPSAVHVLELDSGGRAHCCSELGRRRRRSQGGAHH
jgi:hypothetical protein